ncbi:hypothetical protein B296_00027412 [Ensete ventricosum]|uniref:Uncharacterized protein n=1 Tax=Ensete ventricosum TaxID=4639 RepID=A0A426XKM2_ENSVE|nr:hypothetical protein B296_00027412 [Ensete ventricosum]
MVMEMLTTRRGSGFWRATGSDEEEEVGARQAVGSDEGWLRLRWLQREEDEEGMAGGDYGSKEAEAALLCADGEEGGVGGSSKAEEATRKNGRHGLQRLQWEMAGMADSDEEEGRNYDGWQRKKQPRERKEVVASGGEMGQQQKYRQQMREDKGKTAQRACGCYERKGGKDVGSG